MSMNIVVDPRLPSSLRIEAYREGTATLSQYFVHASGDRISSSHADGSSSSVPGGRRCKANVQCWESAEEGGVDSSAKATILISTKKDISERSLDLTCE